MAQDVWYLRRSVRKRKLRDQQQLPPQLGLAVTSLERTSLARATGPNPDRTVFVFRKLGNCPTACAYTCILPQINNHLRSSWWMISRYHGPVQWQFRWPYYVTRWQSRRRHRGWHMTKSQTCTLLLSWNESQFWRWRSEDVACIHFRSCVI